MIATPSLRRAGAVLAGALAFGLTLSACSADTDAPDTTPEGQLNVHSPQGEASEGIREMVPQAILDAGTLAVATDATIGEPFASYAEDNVTIVGMVPDLAFALSDVLGLEVSLEQATFPNLIPGLAAERFDFSLAPMLDTPERQKEVDFVNYIRGGSGFLVAKDSDRTDLKLGDLCGLKAGYVQGSVEELHVTEQSEECVATGEEPVGLLAYPTNNEGVLALISARIDTYVTAAAQAGFIALTDDGNVKMSGDAFSSGLSAMAFPKNSELVGAIHAGLQELIDNGTYQAILSSYGIENLAVENALINSAEVS